MKPKKNPKRTVPPAGSQEPAPHAASTRAAFSRFRRAIETRTVPSVQGDDRRAATSHDIVPLALAEADAARDLATLEDWTRDASSVHPAIGEALREAHYPASRWEAARASGWVLRGAGCCTYPSDVIERLRRVEAKLAEALGIGVLAGTGRLLRGPATLAAIYHLGAADAEARSENRTRERDLELARRARELAEFAQEPAGEVGGAKGPEKPVVRDVVEGDRGTTKLARRELEFLKALDELRGLDQLSAKTCAQIEEQTYGEANGNLKSVGPELKRRGLVDARPSRGGGYWLTNDGKKALEHALPRSPEQS